MAGMIVGANEITYELRQSLTLLFHQSYYLLQIRSTY